jgi:hypothetical protein
MFAEMPLDNRTVDHFPAPADTGFFGPFSNLTAHERPNISLRMILL